MGNTQSALARAIQNYSDEIMHDKRDDGTTYCYVKPRNGDKRTPQQEALQESIRLAHGDRLPDDWIYSMYASILDTLTGYTIRNAAQLEEYRAEIVDGLVDVYNTDRTAWLASHLGNATYCDEAVSEYGYGSDDKEAGGIFHVIGLGQYYAIDQIYGEIVVLLSEDVSV